jgi:hypothetical protein
MYETSIFFGAEAHKAHTKTHMKTRMKKTHENTQEKHTKNTGMNETYLRLLWYGAAQNPHRRRRRARRQRRRDDTAAGF